VILKKIEIELIHMKKDITYSLVIKSHVSKKHSNDYVFSSADHFCEAHVLPPPLEGSDRSGKGGGGDTEGTAGVGEGTEGSAEEKEDRGADGEEGGEARRRPSQDERGGRSQVLQGSGY